MKNRHIVFFLLLFVLLLSGCGTSPLYNDVNGPSPQPATPTYIEDGQTGGTFTSNDGLFVVTVPASSIPAAYRMNPSITTTTLESGWIVNSWESIVSNTYYELDSNAVDDIITSNNITITIPFDSSKVPSRYLSELYVFAKAYDPSSKWSFPMPGVISGNTLTIHARGLAKKSIFAVVYNPYMLKVTGDRVSTGSILASSTSLPPWTANNWTAHLNGADDKVKLAVSVILSKPQSELTTEEITSTVKSYISNNAADAGTIYQTAGFREPNMRTWGYPFIDTGSTFLIHMSDANTCFQQGNPADALPSRALLGGYILIQPEFMANTSSAALGTIKGIIAHEMLHAIQSGYDIGISGTSGGYYEGPATTYQMTIDKSASTPQVRTYVPSEIMLVSNFLGCENDAGKAYAYANQDFFAYVGKIYNSNSLAYVKDIFEQMKTDVDLLVAGGNRAARLYPPRETLRQSIDTVFSSKFGKSLSTVYFNFAKDRSMEHSSNSILRSGEPSPMKLNASLFNSDAISRIFVDPENLKKDAVQGIFKDIPPLATRAVIITPSKSVDDLNAYLNIIPSIGALGATAKAVVYRFDVDHELSGQYELKNYAKTPSDVLTILISNIDLSRKIDVTYKLSNKEETPVNSFEAMATISGTNIIFEPSYLKGAFGTYTSGTFERTSLPGIYASLGTSLTDINRGLIVILTDPNTVSTSGGTYNFNEAPKVFQNKDGSGASLSFTHPSYTNANDGSQVVFSANGGTITFSAYSSSIGGSIRGTFSANISGTRYKDAEGKISETLTGTITGSFIIELSNIVL